MRVRDLGLTLHTTEAEVEHGCSVTLFGSNQKALACTCEILWDPKPLQKQAVSTRHVLYAKNASWKGMGVHTHALQNLHSMLNVSTRRVFVAFLPCRRFERTRF